MNKKVLTGLLLLSVLFNTIAMKEPDHPILSNPHNMIFGIQGLYLNPDNFKVSTYNSGTTLTNSLVGLDLSTSFKWGYQLSAEYLFSDNKNAKFEWIHYDNTTQNQTMQVDELKGEGSTTIPYDYLSRFDIFNLEIGEWLNLFNGFALRVHGGAQYAYMRTGYHFSYVTNTTGSTQNLQQRYEYHSPGMRIGLDLNYQMTENLHLFINSALSLLDRNGQYHLRNNLINRAPGGAIISREDIDVDSQLKAGLLGTDTYLSLAYQNHAANGNLNLSAGIRSIIYIEQHLKWGGGFIGATWSGHI